MGLINDSFDYFSFEKTMAQEWALDDELLIGKPKDKILNTEDE